MSFGFNFNKYKNAISLESKTSQGLLKMIQEIKCPCEVVQFYHDGVNHIAIVITEKRLIRKLKQE